MSFLLQSELGHTNFAASQQNRIEHQKNPNKQAACGLFLPLMLDAHKWNTKIWNAFHIFICHAAYFRPCWIVTLVQGTARDTWNYLQRSCILPRLWRNKNIKKILAQAVNRRKVWDTNASHSYDIVIRPAWSERHWTHKHTYCMLYDGF